MKKTKKAMKQNITHLWSPINTRVSIYTHANLTSIMVVLALLLLFSWQYSRAGKLMMLVLQKEKKECEQSFISP